jgi:DeoR/GlpR family transcriptional regulator of sugar metabolism
MNETIRLTARQKAIVNLLATQGDRSRGEIAERLPSVLSASKPTVVRDLAVLIKSKSYDNYQIVH